MCYNNNQSSRSSNGRNRSGGQGFRQSDNRVGNQFGWQNGQRFDNSGNNSPTPKQIFVEAGFQATWIKNGIGRELPIFAEKIGKALADYHLTNSKIRSIYGELKRVQSIGYDKAQASFYLLRPKVAYAVGRDSSNKGLQLFQIVYEEAERLVNDQESFNRFCELMEAILAYHKAYGGKE